MSPRLRVLIACEQSGVVRDAFARRGHDAWSCDLMPSETPGQHIQGDVRAVLAAGWDLLIAFPERTYLAVSGQHWNTLTKNGRPPIVGRAEKTEEAVEFFRLCLDSPVERIAVENPVGIISTRIRQPDQIIQPYEFGDDASKKTCLWLKGLPPLIADPTQRVPGRIAVVNGKSIERWSNQTDSGQNRLGPSPDRAKIRSRTYLGIAEAMAASWSPKIIS